MKKFLIAASAAVIALTAPAFAGPVDDSITARKGFYRLVGLNFGGLVQMARGQVAYDAERAAALANSLVALAEMKNLHINAIYLDGSSNFERPGQTRALPEIWEDRNGFMARYAQFDAAVAGLAAAAGQGRGQMAANLGSVGATCKSCHDNYRAETF